MSSPSIQILTSAALAVALSIARSTACSGQEGSASPPAASSTASAARPASSAATPSAAGAVFSADLRALTHLLNRIGYGPRAGDVERVRSVGVHEYILAQLHPENIDDSRLAERLQAYATLDMETSETAALVLEERRRRKERVAADSAARGGVAPDPRRAPLLQLAAAKVERAVHSERQLEEVMVDFWVNHFNVFGGKGADRYLLTSYERDAIRPHALGRFEDLLSATARHPAMLFYLDNWLSVAPGARAPAGLRGKRIPTGINENYARELLELHTLGVDGGYTQQDVIEVARAFTGWSIDQPRRGGGFVYHDWAHDDASKTVLGRHVPPGGGISDGEQVLRLLAAHTSTARFVSTKLAQRFVSDLPPPSLIEKMAETWRLTDGDMREVLHTLLESEEFWDPRTFGAKVKTPFELLVSAVRAMGADLPPQTLLKGLRAMNHVPYGAEAPTGYPETAAAWLDAGTLDQRVQIAELMAARLPLGKRGMDGRRAQIQPASTTMNAQPAAVAASPIGRDPAQVAHWILARLFPGGASSELAAAVQRAAQESPRQALALALASPEFQKQ
jgi:uncharacterized protein (DUF1800 family)